MSILKQLFHYHNYMYTTHVRSVLIIKLELSNRAKTEPYILLDTENCPFGNCQITSRELIQTSCPKRYDGVKNGLFAPNSGIKMYLKLPWILTLRIWIKICVTSGHTFHSQRKLFLFLNWNIVNIYLFTQKTLTFLSQLTLTMKCLCDDLRCAVSMHLMLLLHTIPFSGKCLQRENWISASSFFLRLILRLYILCSCN